MAPQPLRGLHLFLLTTLCLAGIARAQTGGARVTASGGVSQTVTLSLEQGAQASPEGVVVASSNNDGRALVITISGNAPDLTRIRVPIRVRSNAAYRVLVTAKSDGAKLANLSVVEARPTGVLVAADAAALNVGSMFDARRAAGNSIPADRLKRPTLSSPLELLSGPRVSLGGTLLSPQNALEVTLSVAVEPHAGVRVWTTELLLSPAPAAPF